MKGNKEVQLSLSTFKIVSHAMKGASGARGQGTRLQSVAPHLLMGLSPDIEATVLWWPGLTCENKQEP